MSLDPNVPGPTAAERAGALTVLDGLADGDETQLGLEFDGAELSHGQWQKLAVARGLMYLAPLLLVLDEPTAALDPHAEHDLFESFARNAADAGRRNGTITLLVSHRFSTVSIADTIVVLDGGRVTEIGSHSDLMSRNGMYARLYRIQAAGYTT